MKCIVGLGNPGEKYKNNRHNIGQMFIDYLIEKLSKKGEPFVEEKKLQVVSYKLQDIVLAKPLTFMNLSGQAVKRLVTSYKLQVTSDLIVVHDDLDIPLGKFKIQKGVGPLLHNGLESIEKAIGTKEFLRIRIGVDNRPLENRIDGETYVLQNFLPEERKITLATFPKIFARLQNEILVSSKVA